MSDTFNQYFKDIRSGVEFGLQFQLPAGPARVDVAFNPVSEGRKDEDEVSPCWRFEDLYDSRIEGGSVMNDATLES